MTHAFSHRLRGTVAGLALLLSAGMALPATAQSTSSPHGIAAVVNSDIVTTHDLRQRVMFMLAATGVERTEDALMRVQRQALRNLVDEHLQMQEASKYDQSIADEEVNASVAFMAPAFVSLTRKLTRS